jgi:hypothetical protein
MQKGRSHPNLVSDLDMPRVYGGHPFLLRL